MYAIRSYYGEAIARYDSSTNTAVCQCTGWIPWSVGDSADIYSGQSRGQPGRRHAVFGLLWRGQAPIIRAVFPGYALLMTDYLLLLISTVLVNNFVLVKFLGP